MRGRKNNLLKPRVATGLPVRPVSRPQLILSDIAAPDLALHEKAYTVLPIWTARHVGFDKKIDEALLIANVEAKLKALQDISGGNSYDYNQTELTQNPYFSLNSLKLCVKQDSNIFNQLE